MPQRPAMFKAGLGARIFKLYHYPPGRQVARKTMPAHGPVRHSPPVQEPGATRSGVTPSARLSGASARRSASMTPPHTTSGARARPTSPGNASAFLGSSCRACSTSFQTLAGPPRSQASMIATNTLRTREEPSKAGLRSLQRLSPSRRWRDDPRGQVPDGSRRRILQRPS